MPYFPHAAERAYKCQGCGGWFIPGNRSCLVAHAPGTCCHEFEQRADLPIPVTNPNEGAIALHSTVIWTVVED